jgi:hypothetical protein
LEFPDAFGQAARLPRSYALRRNRIAKPVKLAVAMTALSNRSSTTTKLSSGLLAKNTTNAYRPARGGFDPRRKEIRRVTTSLA